MTSLDNGAIRRRRWARQLAMIAGDPARTSLGLLNQQERQPQCLPFITTLRPPAPQLGARMTREAKNAVTQRSVHPGKIGTYIVSQQRNKQ